MVGDLDNSIVHLPELYITKEQLKDIYEMHFGSTENAPFNLFTRDELTKGNTMRTIKEVVNESIKSSEKSDEIKKIAKKADLDISKYDMSELVMGYDVELEHGTVNPETNVTDDDPITTLKIALAHLNEIPDYYAKLKKYVEKENLDEGRKVNPWAICTSSVGRSDKDKYERCVMGVKNKHGMHEDTSETGSVKHKLIIKKSVDNMTPEKIALTKKFIAFCLKELGVNEPCVVYLTAKRGGPIKTTASFFPDNNEIWIYCKNRNMLGDILRSTAHEIRHLRQNIDGEIGTNSGDDGSPEENAANQFSGLMIRKFGKLHPEIYE
jgi:hypothetical protein